MLNRKSLWIATLVVVIPRGVSAADQDIHYNGLGFVTGRAKRASVVTDEPVDTLLLRRQSDDKIIKEIPLEDPTVDPASDVQVYNGDFTDVTEPDIYYMEVPDFAKSRPFPIADDAYDLMFHDALLAMYGWRSGVDVDIEHGGETFHHNAGHLEDGYLDYLGEPGVFNEGTGGWYDAGDYGKYVTNGAFTAGMMLAAWEDFSERLWGVSLDLPEQGGDLPDFLDEVKVELDWLLKMQLPDGTVCHKLSALKFAGFVLPEDATDTRYFTPFASAATADFAAVTAKAARIFEPYDPAFAATCLQAAELSFAYLLEHPENVDLEDHYEDGVSPFATGRYITLDGDDRIWAAAELFETTGDADALDLFETRANGNKSFLSVEAFDWSDVKNLGTFVYLNSERKERDEAVVSFLEGLVVDTANDIVSTADASPFGRGLTTYNWGSNGTAARLCMILQAANRIAPDEAYLDACAAQIDHLYGRNYYGRSQVTGLGYYPPCNPHDRRSGADAVRRPYPGMLVGGGTTAVNWVDTQGSFNTNEVAINWNGALIYALAGFVSGGDDAGKVLFDAPIDDCTGTPPLPPPPHVSEDTDTDTDEANGDTDEGAADAGPAASAGSGFEDMRASDGACSCSAPGAPAERSAFKRVAALLFPF